MAQEGTWEGASRAGPLSELIRLRPVQWDPELCVKAEPPPLPWEPLRSQARAGGVGGSCSQANDSCKGKV